MSLPEAAIISASGSNIIIVGLITPAAWFLVTGIVFPNSELDVISTGLLLSILLLIVCLVLGVIVLHQSGWVLTVSVAISSLFLFFAFMVLASVLEFPSSIL